MMKKIKFILLWNTQKIDILLQKNTGNPDILMDLPRRSSKKIFPIIYFKLELQ